MLSAKCLYKLYIWHICVKTGFGINNLLELICHKKQPTTNQPTKSSLWRFSPKISRFWSEQLKLKVFHCLNITKMFLRQIRTVIKSVYNMKTQIIVDKVKLAIFARLHPEFVLWSSMAWNAVEINQSEWTKTMEILITIQNYLLLWNFS